MDNIKITNVSKKINGKTILAEINLDLRRNQIYGFYGRNASGKTMLFRAVSGLLIPDSGEISVFGEVLGKDVSYPSSMGLIIENVGLWKNLTGYENLKLLAGIRGIIGDVEIKESLQRVGLDPDDRRRYGAYSLGMRQKLAIAQAIMERPQLLILDEPTNSLDEESVVAFYSLLRQEKERGVTCLICSHQKEDIQLLSDEIYMMDNGRCFKAAEVKQK